MKREVGPTPRPAGGFELYTWFFMRVSGLLLLVLALGHLTIMHLINSVDAINYAFVASRYTTPFWRTYDLLLLILALLHGLNGARTIIDDYVRPRGWRLLSLSCLYVLGLIFLTIGSLVILTFHPAGG
ncbi:MAG: succinate dehydrogenase [candidate division NC10 bacterium]|nr:succinate dehydrogenase [candidate division NC10 bacterium]